MLNDLRFAFRTLARAPLFTAVAVLSLALGIGANTAIFSLLHQVLLRSLPVQDPERLVVFHFEGRRNAYSSSDNNASVFSYPFYRDIRDRNQVFDGLIARSSAAVNVISNGQAEQATAEMVSGNFFDVLGVRPLIGRLLTSSDDVTPGGHPVVVLSYGYWTRRFAASAAVLNQTIRVNGLAMTVVGIAPRDFRSVTNGDMRDLYVPMAMKAVVTPGQDYLARRDANWLNIFGHLKPGITRQQAEAALAPLMRAILEEELTIRHERREWFRKQLLATRLGLDPGAQGVNQLKGRWQKPLIAVMVMVGLVLLIACANVANLLVSRASGRRREIAIRLAIGASRWNIMRQLLTESVLLSVAGGAVGLVVTYWIAKGLISFVQTDAANGWLTAQVDARLLAFTFGLSALTGLLFGLAPALSATKPDVVAALKDQGATSSGAQARLRRALAAAQVALSLVLLIAAGLFVRSLVNLMRHDLGFRPERLLVFTIDPALTGYRGAESVALIDRIQERLGALAGVVSAAAAQYAPFGHAASSTNMTVEGYQAAEDENTDARVNAVSAGYFRTIGIPLLAGREFTAADGARAPKVAIINQTFAKHFFQNRNPIGRHIVQGAGTVTPDIEIVGVVRDSANLSIKEKTERFYYLPYLQQKELHRMSFFIRSGRDDGALAKQARGVVRTMDANVPVFNLGTMEAHVEDSIYLERMVAWLAGGFGALAMLLAAMGLYGVIAYMAARRTAEIGIRMALGATRGSILGLVLREVAALVLAGLALGIPAALAAGRLIQSQLFGIEANDLGVMAAAVSVLSLAALLAGYLPARRAASVDPLRALRYE